MASGRVLGTNFERQSGRLGLARIIHESRQDKLAAG
jgi:hypothetical protein